MPKLIRYLKFATASVIVLLISLAFAIALLVNPNHFKPQLSQSIYASTGRQLEINGDIHLSLFPKLSINVGTSTLSNKSGFKDSHFALIESAQFQLKLFPLLGHRFELKSVSLSGVQLNLLVDAQGNNNWDDMLVDLPELPFAKFKLTNTSITYNNLATDEHYQLSQLDLKTQRREAKSIIDIALNTKFQDHVSDIIAELNLSSRANINLLNAEKLTFSETLIDLNITNPNAGTQIQTQLHADISIEHRLQRYSFNNIHINSQIHHPMLPSEALNFSMATQVFVDLAQEQISITELTFNTADVQLNGELQIQNLLSDTHFAAYVDIKPFNGQALITQLGFEALNTPDPDAFKHLGLQFKAQGSREHIQFNDLKLQLDNSEIKGQLEANFSAKKSLPKLRLNASVDKINLAHYVTFDRDANAHSPNKPDDPLTLATELLHRINLDAQLNIDQLLIGSLQAKEVSLPIRAAAGQAHITPITAALYGGQYRGDMRLDMRQVPSIRINENLTNINIGPLMQDIIQSAPITGSGSAKAQLSARGQTLAELITSISGELHINFKDGSLQNFNLPQLIRQTLAEHNKQTATEETTQATHTDFNQLSASFQVENSIIHNQDLAATSPTLTLSGKGLADLAQQQLNYTLTGTLNSTNAASSPNQDIKHFFHQKLPVHITGQLFQPKIKLELSQALKTKASVEKTSFAKK